MSASWGGSARTSDTGAVSLPPNPVRTPSCSPDTAGWVVTVHRNDHVVQVTTACTCGDPECCWHAPAYKSTWFNDWH